MFHFLVTLVHPKTADEATFTVAIASDSFVALLDAVRAERIARKLSGYVFAESFPVPF